MKTLLATLLLLCHYGIATHSHAQASFFDPTFGVGGKTIVPLQGRFEAVITQADNKVVAAGVTENGATIARFKENGMPDSSFGTNGFYFHGGTSSVSLYDLVLQPDGKIVAAGSILMTKRQYLTIRLNPDGTPDATFGSSGIATTDLGPFSNDYGYALALQPDGKIVVAGQTAPSNIGTIRLHPNGVLDSSFGTNGIEKSVYGNVGDVAITADGKILVGGNATASHGHVLMAMRYLPNGTLDTTFNHTGIVYTNAGGSGKSLLLQPDSKILLVGSGSAPGERSNFVVVRYNTDGSLDNTFGADGVADVDFDGADDNAGGMYLSPDGRIFVTGTTGPYGYVKFATACFNNNGTLDNTFGNDGRIVTAIREKEDFARCIVMQGERIIVVGASVRFSSSPYSDPVVVRYLPKASNILDVCVKNNDFLYPNPAHDRLYIRNRDVIEICITDVTGIKMRLGFRDIGGIIDIGNLSNGVYFFRLQFDDGSCLIEKIQVK